MANANKFAYSFNKIPAPGINTDELAAFTRKVNQAFEQLYTQVNGYIQMKNLSTDVQNRFKHLEDLDGNVTELELTAEGLTLAINGDDDHDGLADRVTTVEATANGLSTRVTTAEGNASTALQTANGFSQQISNLSGRVTRVEQEAGGISTTVTGLNGAVTRIDQTLAGLTVTDAGGVTRISGARVDTATLAADSIESHESGGSYLLARVGSEVVDGSPAAKLQIGYADTSHGPYDGETLSLTRTPDGSAVEDGSNLRLSGGSAAIDLLDGGLIQAAGDLVPERSGYHLGHAASGQRWKRVHAESGTIETSDARRKRDVKPLGMSWLLERLEPVRYRWREGGKIRFGLIAQQVRCALGGMDADLVDEEDPACLGLEYAQLIAVLVEGWQAHEKIIKAQQARIENLEARLERLEKKLGV